MWCIRRKDVLGVLDKQELEDVIQLMSDKEVRIRTMLEEVGFESSKPENVQ